MQWIELLIAILVGLITSISLISFILQATDYGRNAGRRGTPGPMGPKLFGGGLALVMGLIFCVLAVLLECGFFLKSEHSVVFNMALVIAGVLLGLIVGNTLMIMVLQASGDGGRARDAHHTHQIPVPRLGGVAMAGALVAVVLVFIVFFGSDFVLSGQRWPMIVSSLAMFGLGLWDDLLGLGAKRKLFLQLLIASLTYSLGIAITQFRMPFVDHLVDLGFWAWPVTVIWLVAMTNLINLIDGVDGLAGGICLMLMVLLLYVSHETGTVPTIYAGMIGAILGFLKFNFPPARIYMGDGGAYFLGYLIGCSTIVTSQKGTIFAGLVAPLFVLALPIIDTSLAILRRGLRGLPVFRPDRKHIHHRLLAMGHSRKTVVLGLYAFTAFFLLLGLATFCLHGQYFPVIAGIALATVLVLAGKLSFSREWFSIGRVVGNSLMARQDVHYAMCLCRWLVLEGVRADSVNALAADALLIASKLGFSSVRMRLHGEEKYWRIVSLEGQTEDFLRHRLPAHGDSYLEMGVLLPPSVSPNNEPAVLPKESSLEILADLLAEAWGKALSDWEKVNNSLAQFSDASEATQESIELTLIRGSLKST